MQSFVTALNFLEIKCKTVKACISVAMTALPNFPIPKKLRII